MENEEGGYPGSFGPMTPDSLRRLIGFQIDMTRIRKDAIRMETEFSCLGIGTHDAEYLVRIGGDYGFLTAYFRQVWKICEYHDRFQSRCRELFATADREMESFVRSDATSSWDVAKESAEIGRLGSSICAGCVELEKRLRDVMAESAGLEDLIAGKLEYLRAISRRDEMIAFRLRKKEEEWVTEQVALRERFEWMDGFLYETFRNDELSDGFELLLKNGLALSRKHLEYAIGMVYGDDGPAGLIDTELRRTASVMLAETEKRLLGIRERILLAGPSEESVDRLIAAEKILLKAVNLCFP